MDRIHFLQGCGAVPGMKFHNQSSRPDSRIGACQLSRFFDCLNVEEIDSSQVAVLKKGTSKN